MSAPEHAALARPREAVRRLFMRFCAVRVLQIVVSCSKGISNDTLETVNQIMTRVLPPPLHSRLAYLSGPSFAAEVQG